MRLGETILLLVIITFLIIAGIFIGSITGQAIRGETTTFTTAENVTILVTIFLLIQITIITYTHLRKPKEKSVNEVVEEAKKEKT